CGPKLPTASVTLMRSISASRKLLPWCGVVGPLLFTAAWVAGSLRQTGHSAADVQLRGLAAMDARDPQILIAGFVGLGTCSIVFGDALRQSRVSGTAAPWLVMCGGAATAAAGVFRRDHMLLTGPGFAGESWHNQVHDVVSGAAYTAMLVAPLVLSRRFRTDSAWAPLSRPILILGLISAGALALFATRLLDPWNPVLQRAAVTLSLSAEVLIAARVLTLDRPNAAVPGGC
ncbi:MAG TPA: DUF998 domain-containing protein, partial [Streptosporangiaceae bacterium]